MADYDTSKYLKAYDPATPMQDRFNYEAFLSDISGLAGQTRQVTSPAAPVLPKSGIPGLNEADRLRYEAAVKAYEAQKPSLQQQANKAAAAMEMKGASTAESMQRYGQLSTQAAEREATASASYAAAGEKAEEYVQATRDRAVASTTRLDEINKSIGEGRDFAQAHAAQAAVQATIGSMNEEGRTISERYGSDSKEYQQWQARKSTTLATVNSNITTSFQQLQEAQDIAHMNASNELMWKSDMYINYQEQMHVETLMNMANYSQQYSLATAQLQVNIEQLRGAAMDDMANWIIGTPSFSMDLSPLVSIFSDIISGAEARAEAGKEKEAALMAEKRAYVMSQSPTMSRERGQGGGLRYPSLSAKYWEA